MSAASVADSYTAPTSPRTAISPTSAASVRPIPRSTRRPIRQAGDSTSIVEGRVVIMVSFRVFLSAILLSMRYVRPRRTQHHFGHAACVLAGLRSIAQVQGCVVVRRGGQQE